MPEEVEVETKDLQDTIGELQERHEAGKSESSGEKEKPGGAEKQPQWIRYIVLSTAIFAVFAAIGAMQSGSFVNEAMMLQIKASDTWSEYQASKQKEYLFTTQADTLLDRGILPAATTGVKSNAEPAQGGAKGGTDREKPEAWKGIAPEARLAQLIGSADKEREKTVSLKEQAEKYEKESEAFIERHHRFAWSVALIQVAIALAAIAALTRIRLVWVLSLVIGLFGLYYFALGSLVG